MNKILVVVAHPDDEILGVGGAIKNHVNNGDEVYCLILGEGMTSRKDTREETEIYKVNSLHEDCKRASDIMGLKEVYFSKFPDNRFDSVDLLDIVKTIEEYVEKIKPSIVYTHHYGDLNIDHKKTFEAVLTACRPVGEYSVKEIYAFETPSSTEWNFEYGENTFKPNVFLDITDVMEEKLQAMSCYTTELGQYPHPRSLKALEIIAARWGTVVGKQYVEAFELIRKII